MQKMLMCQGISSVQMDVSEDNTFFLQAYKGYTKYLIEYLGEHLTLDGNQMKMNWNFMASYSRIF